MTTPRYTGAQVTRAIGGAVGDEGERRIDDGRASVVGSVIPRGGYAKGQLLLYRAYVVGGKRDALTRRGRFESSSRTHVLASRGVVSGIEYGTEALERRRDNQRAACGKGVDATVLGHVFLCAVAHCATGPKVHTQRRIDLVTSHDTADLIGVGTEIVELVGGAFAEIVLSRARHVGLDCRPIGVVKTQRDGTSISIPVISGLWCSRLDVGQ